MKTYNVYVNVKEDGKDVWATDLGYEEAKEKIKEARELLGSCCLDTWMEPYSGKRLAEIETGY